MKRFTIKPCLAAIGLAVAAIPSLQAQVVTFEPIQITPSSFTQEIVVPTNWTYKLNNQSVTVTIDHGPTLQTDTVSGFPTYYSLDSGDTYFEIGMERASATTLGYGIPAGGSLLTNITLSSTTQLHYYQLPYWTNYDSNCLCIAPYTTNGSPTYNSQPLTGGPYVGQNYNTNVNLTLVNTNSYAALSLLCTGGGPFSNTVTIAYADGTIQSNVDFAVPNWFLVATTSTYGVGTPTAAVAYTCLGRCNPAENQNAFTISSGVTSGTRLWSVDVALTDTTSYPTNLAFAVSYANSGTTAAEVIIAVSGSTNPNDNKTVPNNGPLTGPFAPITVSGYNAGFVVANSPQTLAGLAPLTATMDNGTNLAGGANTWFEQGWDQAAPTNGFPPHGSVLTSSANPTFHYQMPLSYNAPMSVLIDHNHVSNNITPLNTNVSYTAFSLLTCGASINSGNVMTNYIILQHADGVNESNLFKGYDWFEAGTATLTAGVKQAYNASERVNIGSSTSTTGREVDNLDGGYPGLFDSEFPMLDASPITNIVVGYLEAPGASSTTYVIAVSATTNYIPMEVPISYTAAQNVYPGQTAVFVVSNYVGTLPSYQWQITDGLTFTNNLTNGTTGTGSTISGANTNTLVIYNVSPADTGTNTYYYTCLLSNLAPSSTNSVLAPLTLLVSSATNVVHPGDSISDFFGSSYTPGEAYPSPVGLTAGYVIDGTDEQYLNWGASGGDTSFVGPIGIIVQPSAGSTVLSGLRFIVPVNAPICDPADFSLDGSKDGVNWSNIVPDEPLNLPNQRNITQTEPVNVNNQVMQEVDFLNNTNYNYYRVTFQNVKGGGTANSLQIGEIQFLGALANLPPAFLQQPAPPVQALEVGGSVTWDVLANGPGPISYQWYQITNATTTNQIGGATGTSYSVDDVQLASSGAYFCVASNAYGYATSSIVTFTVSASTSHYVSTVLGDGPIAFYRLDEGPNNPPNDGAVAYDIVGGHNGVYSNTVLQQPGVSTNDPDDYAAQFGTMIDPDVYANPLPSALVPQDNYVGGITGINFGSPTNTLTNMSVEAWVYLGSSTQVSGAGVVAAGWGGGEQFAMDMGGTDNAFRYYFRYGNAGTNSLTVSPNVTPVSNVWYHVVGVLNEVTNATNATYTNYAANVSLYLNGALAATNQALYTNAPGVFNTNSSISIGARPSSSATNDNFQLNGSMADVAIYDYALTGAQVSNHFNATFVGPGILVQPAPLVQDMQVGGDMTWSMAAYGPGPITYQWFEVTTNGGGAVSTNMVQNATNAVFDLVDATASAGYFCVASSPYGAASTIMVTANVLPPTSPYVNVIVADEPIAFLRLDEGPNNQPNDGVIAYDSMGGHDGYYSNTVLQASPGYSVNDPLELAAQFGITSDPLAGDLNQDNLVAGINGIDFFSPTNTSTNLSVEAWVYLYADAVSGAGIVSKGYGGGGEEFALDTGGTDEAFRFYFRNVGGASFTVSPNVAPLAGNWYHVVGVLNESSNVEYVYTNGVLAATTALTPAAKEGLLSNDVAPVVIGSRSSASTTNYNLQLDGYVANVAIYPYALSATQVANHWLASGVAPTFTVVPTNVTVPIGQSAPAEFYSVAFGTSNFYTALVYQWSYNGQNLVNGSSPTGTGAVVEGVNTPNLTLSGFTLGDSGDTFTVTAANAYGSVSASAQLSVAAGAPQVVTDLQQGYTFFAGAPFSLSATFSGTVPFTYHWLYNGAPLASSARISGASSNILIVNPALVSDSGAYQLEVSNTYGSNYSTASVVTVLPYLSFNGFGGGWTFNTNVAAGYSGGYTSSNILELTDGNLSEAASSFFSNRVYCGAFQASYVYTDVGGNGGLTDNADGACFVLQNSSSGAAALGGDGGSFGYAGITPSVALQFNLYQNSTYGGTGIDFAQNGVDAETLNTFPLLVDSGDPINVTVTYIGDVFTASLQDTNAVPPTSYTLTTNIDIPALLGTNMAYAGITGGDGGTASVQTVANFQYTPLPDVTAQAADGNITVSWPVGTGGYQLESNSNLDNTNGWINVSAQPTVTNNQNQVTIPLSAGPEFYRLQLQ